MNIFQSNYDARLRDWRDLRLKIQEMYLDEACIEVDKWWQQAPFVSKNLHPSDSSSWPDPWTMLSENVYCQLTKAIGMCYTLLLRQIEDIEIVLAADHYGEEYFLVLVGNQPLILNYWPDTVLSNNIKDFTIKYKISTDSLKEKIR